MEEKTPQLEWRDGVPVSEQFDDPYYSLDDGLAESRFVFLEGVNLRDLAENIDDAPLVIGETGFGTGLNFLATWQWWRENAPSKKLTFISAEKYPLSASDLALAHKAFPELLDLSAELVASWPPPARGFHTLIFDGGDIRLILLFDDAANAFSKLTASIDAWYLDGFAPAKNPEMWNQSVFKAMAALSKPGAPVATFTAAGFVRRGLIEAGFSMSKHPGYGRKRERLLGHYEGAIETTSSAPPDFKPPEWAKICGSKQRQTATIIGGGIAGASAAYALKQRGLAVTVIEADNAPSSKGLPAAILVPRFLLQDQPERHFFDAAFASCLNHPVYKEAFSECVGAELLALSDEDMKRFEKIVPSYDWPDEWLCKKGKSLCLPRAGTVNPSSVLGEMLQNCTRVSAAVTKIENIDGRWRVFGDDNGCIATSDILVVAAGPNSEKLLSSLDAANDGHPALVPNLGQLAIVPDRHLGAITPYTLSYGGYVSAAIEAADGQAIRTVGSTFDKLQAVPQRNPAPSQEAKAKILEQLAAATGNVDIQAHENSISDWTGVRATVPDHMPYCGPVPMWDTLKTACAPLAIDAKADLSEPIEWQPGLYCMTGLGSKGFQYGPILGEYLAAMICEEALPLSNDLIAKLHPARSMVRAIIRSNPTPNN